MIEIQYGIGHNRSSANPIYVWVESRQSADDTIAELGGGRYLVAREVGKPYEVKELPTTPGSVIRHQEYGYMLYRRSNSTGGFYWFAADTDKAAKSLGRDTWTLVFDAGAVSE